VLKGTLEVETLGGTLCVEAGQAVIVEPNVWVRYSTPGEQGAEYISVVLPAFDAQRVHRDLDTTDTSRRRAEADC
jgi:quercetin dioxygenase-like cupin family protein